MHIIFRRYVFTFVALTLAAISTVILINYVVDPYGLWRSVSIERFNASKSERRNQTHLFKSADLRKPLPPVLIIGSSRTAYGIDPNHKLLIKMGGAYNAATPGGHLTVVREYLEFALKTNPNRIRTVLFGLDFFELNETAFSELPSTFSIDRLTPERQPIGDILNVLFTLDALRTSVATVMSNLREPDYQPYYKNGQLTAIDMRNNVETHGMIRRFELSLNLYLNRPKRFGNFRWSDDAFSEFERIVSICRERNIELIAFTSPTHASHLEATRKRGVWDEFELWKRRLATVTPYWDFTGYNDVTMEPLDFEMNNYWDISHYRSNIGDQMLTRMLNPTIESNFGVKVTPDTVNTALEKQLEGRPAWLRKNGELLNLIERIQKPLSSPRS